MNKTIFQVPGKFIVTLKPGIYKFECWGAQGGTGCENGEHTTEGGRGAYASGYMHIKEITTFYCFVGGKGGDGSPDNFTIADGGYNGGGKGGMDIRDNDGSGGGGGASDIRTINGSYSDINSLQSRIIVAAGGSGSAFKSTGAPGGNLTGYVKTSYPINSIIESNTTNQTNGYALGIGEDGHEYIFTPSSGAGGGFYGGFAGQVTENNTYIAVSSSGSSYVSGYDGCIPNEKYVFSKAEIFHGNKEFLDPSGEKTTGKIGDGAIVITQINGHTSFKTRIPFNYKSLFL